MRVSCAHSTTSAPFLVLQSTNGHETCGYNPTNLARAEQFINASDMEQRCEVCESFRPRGELGSARALLEVRFGERSVLLCRGHAGIARNSEISTFEELRALYAESEGQRSYVSRRASATESGGKPRSPGRRSSDLAR